MTFTVLHVTGISLDKKLEYLPESEIYFQNRYEKTIRTAIAQNHFF